MRVAGIGCRKGVATSEVLAAIEAALVQAGLRDTQINALATTQMKAEEPAIRSAGDLLQLPVLMPCAEALHEAGARCLTLSAASQRHADLPSLSEAAALAAVGPNARLVGPRLAVGHVTCAIAISEETP